MATFIYKLWSNIWPIMLSFEDIHKKVIHQKFVWRQTKKITFLWISSKLSTIGLMLLLVLYWESLYDLQGPNCKNPIFAHKGYNWAWPHGVCAAGSDNPPCWFRAGLALATIINSQRYMILNAIQSLENLKLRLFTVKSTRNHSHVYYLSSRRQIVEWGWYY